MAAAMGGSEAGPGPLDARLLRDISHGAARSTPAPTAEQEVLRLSADPLLLQQFLMRDLQGSARVAAALTMTGDSAVSLAALAAGPGAHGEELRQQAYARREPRNMPSLEARAFAPTADDVAAALDVGGLAGGEPRLNGRARPGAFLLAAAAALRALLEPG